MKWLLLADLHFKKENLLDMEHTLSWITRQVTERQPTHVILLGDSLHTRISVDVETLQKFKQFITFLQDHPTKPSIHILIGNHDMSDRHERSVNSPSILENVSKQTFVYSEINEMFLDNQAVIFVPFHENQQIIRNYLLNVQNKNDKIIFCHVALDGAKVNGFSNESNILCTGSNLGIRDFQNFKRVFAGHFHHHASYGDNFMYVGSPMMFSFGDVGQKKRGAVLYEPLENYHELLVNPHAERFFDLNLFNSQDITSIDLTVYQHKHVRLRLQVNISDLELINIKNKMLDAGVLNVSSVNDFTVENNVSQPVADSYDIRSLLQQFFLDKTDPYTLNLKDFMQNILDSVEPRRSASRFVGEIQSVVVKNFLGIRGEKTFDISKLEKGLWFILGDNGSGKTTFSDAIAFALFGKVSRPAKNNEIVNNNFKNHQCFVTVKFENGYYITREKEQNKKSFVLKIRNPDGTFRQMASVKKTEEMLFNIFHFTWETCQRISILNNHNICNCFTEQDKNRTEMIENTIGLELLNTIHNDIDTKFNEVKELSSKVNGELHKNEIILKTASEALASLQNALSQCNLDFSNYSTLLDKNTCEFLTLKSSCDVSQQTLHEIDKNIDKNIEIERNLSKNYEILEKQRQQLEIRLHDIHNKYSTWERLQDSAHKNFVHAFQKKQNLSKIKIETVKDIESTKEIILKQETILDKHTLDFTSLEKEIETIDNKISDLTKSLEQQKGTLTIWISKDKHLQTEVKHYGTLRDNSFKNVKNLEQEISHVKEILHKSSQLTQPSSAILSAHTDTLQKVKDRKTHLHYLKTSIHNEYVDMSEKLEHELFKLKQYTLNIHQRIDHAKTTFENAVSQSNNLMKLCSTSLEEKIKLEQLDQQISLAQNEEILTKVRHDARHIGINSGDPIIISDIKVKIEEPLESFQENFCKNDELQKLKDEQNIIHYRLEKLLKTFTGQPESIIEEQENTILNLKTEHAKTLSRLDHIKQKNEQTLFQQQDLQKVNLTSYHEKLSKVEHDIQRNQKDEVILLGTIKDFEHKIKEYSLQKNLNEESQQRLLKLVSLLVDENSLLAQKEQDYVKAELSFAHHTTMKPNVNSIEQSKQNRLDFLQKKVKLSSKLLLSKSIAKNCELSLHQSKGKLDTLEKTLKNTKQEILSHELIFQMMEHEIDDINTQEPNTSLEKNGINQQLRNLLERIKENQSKKYLNAEADSNLRKEKEQAKKHLNSSELKKTELEHTLIKYSTKCEDSKQRCKEFEQKIEIAKQNVDDVNVEFDLTKSNVDDFNLTLGYIRYWKDALSTTSSKGVFRKYCLQRYIEAINRKLSENLLCINNGNISDLNCYIDENMKLVTRNSRSTSFSQMSAGEQKKTQLAVLFTIMDFMSGNCDYENRLLFIDEIYDSLDEYGRRVVENWISEYARKNTKLHTFIVTHQEIEHSGGRTEKGIIRVKKDRNIGSKYIAINHSRSAIQFFV